MTFIVFIVVLGILAAGTINNVRNAQADAFFKKNGVNVKKYEYNFLLTVISGLGCTVALAGLVMMSAGSLGKAGVVLGGLAVSVLACLPAFKQKNEEIRLMKKYGKEVQGNEGILPLLKEWVQITLLGVGKVVHGVFICTLIGIPLYNMIKQIQLNTDNLIQQIQLRQELDELRRREGK